MRSIFGAKKEKPPAPTLDETTDKLGGRSDRIDVKIRQLDAQLVQYKEQISKTRPGPAQDAIKRRAVQVLKQKRMYEAQQSQLMQQQFNVEQTKFTVDNMKDTVSTVQAMTAAQKEMKKMMKEHKELDISRIDKMQDDMWDMMDMSNEINEALGRTYGIPDGVDESDLMAELDALESDMTMEESLGAGGTPSYLQEPDLDLPAAPTQERPQSEANMSYMAMKA